MAAGAGCGCATWCAIAGSARATAADAISNGLVRIAALRHSRLNRARRLFLRERREEHERADDQHEHNDQDCKSGHGKRFCRGREPLYSPLR